MGMKVPISGEVRLAFETLRRLEDQGLACQAFMVAGDNVLMVIGKR